MVAHGVDGWQLEEMDWDPNTGLSRFDYSRQVPKALEERCAEIRMQPTVPEHLGWSVLGRQEQQVFTIVPSAS